MPALVTDNKLLRERAILGYKDPYYLGTEIIGLSKDEIRPYYEWLDRPRPERMPKLQQWLRFWSMPRFTGKTYGLLVWLTGRIIRDPNVRVMIQGEEKQMATDSVMLIREWLESPEVVRLYGEFKSEFWLKDQLRVSQRDIARKDPTLRALGLDVPMQGKRCDINVWDDLVGETNYQSDEALMKIEQRVAATMPIIVPGGMGIYVCTRWSPYDLSTDKRTVSDHDGIIRQWKNFNPAKQKYPTWDCAPPRGYFGAFAQEGDEKTFPDAVVGEPLFPTVLDDDEIDNKRRTMRQELFASQVLNNPIPAETQHFKPEDLQYFSFMNDEGDKNEILSGAVPFLGVDPASGRQKLKSGRSGDDTAFVVVYIKWLEHLFNVYVVEWMGGRWLPNRVYDTFFNLVEKHRPRRIFWEANVGGEFTLNPIRNRAKSMGLHLPLDDFTASLHGTGKKDAGISSIQGYYTMRQVWHEESLKNCKGEDQALRWQPNSGGHDDYIDILARTILKATAKKIVGRSGTSTGRKFSLAGSRRYTHTGL